MKRRWLDNQESAFFAFFAGMFLILTVWCIDETATLGALLGGALFVAHAVAAILSATGRGEHP